jgi:hypothetical protein
MERSIDIAGVQQPMLDPPRTPGTIEHQYAWRSREPERRPPPPQLDRVRLDRDA